MIARIQLKGVAAEVFVDEVAPSLISDPKKWGKDPNSNWKSYNKIQHIYGVVNTEKPTIILLDKGNEFMSYKMKTFWDGYYNYNYLSKTPTSSEKVSVTAIESSKGVVFDSGDFECPDNTKWGHFYFDITRTLAFDTDRGETLDLELITSVYLNKEKYDARESLPNIAQPEKKKSIKLYIEKFNNTEPNKTRFDYSLLKPSWA